jgi:hypothetical protein
MIARTKVAQTQRVVQVHRPHVYVKAVTLRDVRDLDDILQCVKRNMIVIVRVTPLAQKSVEDVRIITERLYGFSQSVGGDIARLGEERVIITPSQVKVWKTTDSK